MLGIHNLSPEMLLLVFQSAVVLRLWIEEHGQTTVSVDFFELFLGLQVIKQWLISDTNLDFVFRCPEPLGEIHDPSKSLAYSESHLFSIQ